MKVIDAKDMILGRLASKAAKLAILGETVRIVNCEEVVISGDRTVVLNRYKVKVQKGSPAKGPYFPRRPDMIVKRTIRTMLPYKKDKGEVALKRIKCYLGIPEELKNNKIERFEDLDYKKLSTPKHVRLGEISKLLGAKF